MWEMEMLKALKNKKSWIKLDELKRPSIIGPDRASVQHTLNVLQSFSGNAKYFRP